MSKGAYALKALGLPPDASEDDVRRAYRQLAKRAHPDRGGSKIAFQELERVYRIALGHAERGSAHEGGHQSPPPRGSRARRQTEREARGDGCQCFGCGACTGRQAQCERRGDRVVASTRFCAKCLAAINETARDQASRSAPAPPPTQQRDEPIPASVLWFMGFFFGFPTFIAVASLTELPPSAVCLGVGAVTLCLVIAGLVGRREIARRSRT